MSLLPEAIAATIDDAKITKYLLEPSRSLEAAAKARFFGAHGFTSARWRELKKALLDHPQVNAVTASAVTPFGEKYEVRCSLVTPDGRNPCIVSVWIVERPNPSPRFVTAYPNPP